MHAGIVESFFLIFAGAAVLAAVALYTRQPLLVAYIAVGGIAGPHGFGWVNDASMVSEISEIGIIFLLFLVGLDLQPSKLRNMVGSAVVTAVGQLADLLRARPSASCAHSDSPGSTRRWQALACMFSSTIVGLKLLPTTVLHHRHIGEIVVSLLLIQDLIAILALIILSGRGTSVTDALDSVVEVFVALPSLVIVAFVVVRFLVLPLMHKFDAFHEFIFLAAIGWCLAVASGAKAIGLSFEIGAFVAGVSLATSPIAQYIAESLRPLRDFFLVMFFFSVGAAIHFDLLAQVALPTLVLAVLLIGLKPVVFRWLIALQGDSTKVAWEAGVPSRSDERVLAAGGLPRDEPRAHERAGIARRPGRHRADVHHLDVHRDLPIPEPDRGIGPIASN